MCGIVGAVAQRNIVALLLQGLQRLEYRGYDSAGLAVIDNQGQLQCLRRVGKVKTLTETVHAHLLQGNSGIAHTRWATHGVPSERNAHPHVYQHIVVVHNGIIENYQALRALQQERGYIFSSDTDTEVIAHLVHWEQQQSGESLRTVVQRVIPQLQGAYGMVLLDSRDPQCLVAARAGSPLVIGCGQGEYFIASDQQALLSVTHRLIFLQEGDVAEITPDGVALFDRHSDPVERQITDCQTEDVLSNKGAYRHYMQKEIYEQPLAIQRALEGRIIDQRAHLGELGPEAQHCLSQVQHIQLLACGTSYNAAVVARYWFEALAYIPCDVEIASEFRYRHSVTRKNSLLIVLSQSGETADTLAALRLAKGLGYRATLALCNNSGSSLVREADFALMLRAGTEIGVASTKAFTAQLTLLLLLVAFMSRLQGRVGLQEETIINALQRLPQHIEQVLALEPQIKAWAIHFISKAHVLFVGRGEYYPVAMEGALKLKEISYIHAEAYAAGELKHGPLALIDDNMPVVVIAPSNALLEKLKSTVEEVRARGGQVYVLTDHNAHLASAPGLTVLALPAVEPEVAPIYYTVPLQLLAYSVALLKGTDIDQPRNLAKSVTVE